MDTNKLMIPSLYPDVIGILPNAQCDFKIADRCIPTNHYCRNEKNENTTTNPPKFMLYGNTPICGKVCCSLCMCAAGLEGGDVFRCPDCQDSTKETGNWKERHRSSTSSTSATQKLPESFHARNQSTIQKSRSSTSFSKSPSATLLVAKNSLLAKICRDETMYIDHKVFFEALQEVMIPLSGKKKSYQHYRPNGINGQYKLIWNCAQLFFDKFSAKKEYFHVTETHRSYRAQKLLCDWIYHGSRRNSIRRRDMMQDLHPNVWNYAKDLNPDTVVHLLDQSHLFEHAVNLWGVTDKIAPNVAWISKVLPRTCESLDKKKVSWQSFVVEHDGGAENELKKKRCHSDVIRDLSPAWNLLNDAEAEYRKKKKRSRTKMDDLKMMKENVRIYKVNVDFLHKELVQFLGGQEMINALKDFDISSDSSSDECDVEPTLPTLHASV